MTLVQLSEVAEINPRQSSILKGLPDQEVSFLPMDAIGEDGQVRYQEKRNLSDVLKGYTTFKRGDVLLAKITPCMENGKAAQLDGLETLYGAGSTEFHVIRPSERLDAKYLFYLIWNPNFRLVAESKMTGSAGQKRVPADFLKALAIPLPPIEEQRRIAAILDKADAIRQKRKSALTLADTFLRATFLDMFGDPVTNPKGWDTPLCSDICSRITVGLVVKPASYYRDTGIPALRSLNVREDFINERDMKFFSEEDTKEKLSKSRVWKDDVVIVRSGQPGTAAVIPERFDGVNAIDILIATPNQEKVLPRYLSAFLNSPAGRRFVLSEGRGQIQQHLNVGSLNKAPIPLPPINLQQKYIDQVVKIEAKKERLRRLSEQSEALFASLSQRAFKGEL